MFAYENAKAETLVESIIGKVAHALYVGLLFRGMVWAFRPAPLAGAEEMMAKVV